MSQPFFLRRLSRSRTLRAIMVLAWMLMTVSLPAMPADSMDNATHGTHAVSMVHAMHAHAVGTSGQHANQCCGGASQPACHCDAMCGSVLLPSVPSLSWLTLLAMVRVPMRRLDAPAPSLAPPLRPPAA